MLSQILTLYTTPVVYLYLDKLNNLFGKRKPTTTADKPVPAAAAE